MTTRLRPLLLVTALVTALLAVLLVSVTAAAAPADRHPRDREVTLLQVNQCLSGLAGCFGRTAYPAVVEETVDLVREHDADAVVLNESCRGDAAQEGAEERRLACVLTDGLTVCGTHLSTRGTAAAQAANDGQCAELAATVRRLARLQPVVASGDVNRLPSCLGRPFRTVTDAAAAQAPGIQHGYADPRLGRLRGEVEPATYTDHDVLVVRFRGP